MRHSGRAPISPGQLESGSLSSDAWCDANLTDAELSGSGPPWDPEAVVPQKKMAET
jgi:hypothetical protein